MARFMIQVAYTPEAWAAQLENPQNRMEIVMRSCNEVGVQPSTNWVLAEGEDAAVLTPSVPIDKMSDDAFIA